LCQHGPGDPRQLVGKSCGQNVRIGAGRRERASPRSRALASSPAATE
jgi:hypothetical protein